MRKPEPSRERAQAEQALLGTPLPRGGGLPPALFVNRPFTWPVASVGVSQRLVAVQPYLVASGVALTASGFYGLWPLRTRSAEETARA